MTPTELHSPELILDHSKCLARLEERIEFACSKIEKMERNISERFISRDKDIELAKIDIDRRIKRIEDLETKVATITTIISQKTGSGYMVNYIITALISMSIFLVAHFLFKF